MLLYFPGKSAESLQSRQLLCRFFISDAANLGEVHGADRSGGTLSLARWQNCPALSYLESTLTQPPATVDSKPLTAMLSPLSATLTKNQEGEPSPQRIVQGYGPGTSPTVLPSAILAVDIRDLSSPDHETRVTNHESPITGVPRPCRGHCVIPQSAGFVRRAIRRRSTVHRSGILYAPPSPGFRWLGICASFPSKWFHLRPA